jgi:hypothetical protein
MVILREREGSGWGERSILEVLSGSLSELETLFGSWKCVRSPCAAGQFSGSESRSVGPAGAGTVPGGTLNGVMCTPGATIVDSGGCVGARDAAGGFGAAVAGGARDAIGSVGCGSGRAAANEALGENETFDRGAGA